MKQFLFRYAVAAGILCLIGLQEATAQSVRLMGMITDADTRTGLPAVTVWNKRSGMGSVSSETGRYYIEALPGDTIEFSSISYVRTAYVAPGISATRNVEMKRHIMGLQGINIRGRIYKQDSLAMRDEYERYFGYKRPGAMDVLKTLPSNPITALTYLVPSKARKRREKFGNNSNTGKRKSISTIAIIPTWWPKSPSWKARSWIPSCWLTALLTISSLTQRNMTCCSSSSNLTNAGRNNVVICVRILSNSIRKTS